MARPLTLRLRADSARPLPWRVVNTSLLVLLATAPLAALGEVPLAPAGALSEKESKEKARNAYKAAETAFREGKFEDALAAYRQADEALPIAATKYKVALCLDKLGRANEASTAYQAFLDSKPDPKKMADAIGEAKDRIEALKQAPGASR